jgi:hypothetical protein
MSKFKTGAFIALINDTDMTDPQSSLDKLKDHIINMWGCNIGDDIIVYQLDRVGTFKCDWSMETVLDNKGRTSSTKKGKKGKK